MVKEDVIQYRLSSRMNNLMKLVYTIDDTDTISPAPGKVKRLGMVVRISGGDARNRKSSYLWQILCLGYRDIQNVPLEDGQHIHMLFAGTPDVPGAEEQTVSFGSNWYPKTLGLLQVISRRNILKRLNSPKSKDVVERWILTSLLPSARRLRSWITYVRMWIPKKRTEYWA